MKRRVLAGVCGIALAGVAYGGHELPVYPSFYPHEIEIRTIGSADAAGALRQGSIHAFVGSGVRFPRTLPDTIDAVESLGSLVVVRLNPESEKIRAGRSVCAVAAAVVRELAENVADFVPHPYPVTPFHGDYLAHADIAEAAKARFSALVDEAIGKVEIEADGSIARAHPEWSRGPGDWDARIAEVGAADLLESSELATNGHFAPPWLKAGWFAAWRLLGEAITDTVTNERINSDVERLQRSDFNGLADRLNLERGLVRSLTAGCASVVAGYTVKREFFNSEFSAGVENIGFDSIEGLRSPMFIRTVKLKDFPWNGWLALGIADSPKAAWNPIAGMDDRFGRLLRFTIIDPALVPAPYDSGWMLNRIADLPTSSSP